MKERADLGFDDELEGFDPADWAPKPKAKPKPEAQAASRELAEATGFRSREPARAKPDPKPAKPKKPAKGAGETKPVRRRRTGRNAQFNIKTKPETIEAFYAIADARGWGLGETLEHAVSLMQKERR
ncbi:stability/partitioning determinant [Pacificoceanicola onchidii]|uniref:stability/partitioning determinant n=1 Tax=Pacificoceanicola onchidii TaxID=2562685 RepID=UPI0010A6AE87|nr:stability/partitioning determinant [Pacificoceanicola onchidii]